MRRIEVNGKLASGVYAKDVILAIIRRLGANGGIGYAYEYAGDVLDAMTLEEHGLGRKCKGLLVHDPARDGPVVAYCMTSLVDHQCLRPSPFRIAAPGQLQRIEVGFVVARFV